MYTDPGRRLGSLKAYIFMLRSFLVKLSIQLGSVM